MTNSLRGELFKPAGPLPQERDMSRTDSLDDKCDNTTVAFEAEWQGRLRNLEMLICELLHKNEQLRMALSAKTWDGQD